MAQQIIRSIGSDGKEVLSNILDRYTGEQITYKETDIFYNNEIMDDAKVDGVIYIKNNNKYYIREFNEVDVRWFGAKGDGITDDTLSVRKALTTISGFKINFDRNKTYIITSHIRPSANIHIDLNFSTLKFKIPTANNIHLLFLDDYSTVENGSVELEHGIPGITPSTGENLAPISVGTYVNSDKAPTNIILRNLKIKTNVHGIMINMLGAKNTIIENIVFDANTYANVCLQHHWANTRAIVNNGDGTYSPSPIYKVNHPKNNIIRNIEAYNAGEDNTSIIYLSGIYQTVVDNLLSLDGTFRNAIVVSMGEFGIFASEEYDKQHVLGNIYINNVSVNIKESAVRLSASANDQFTGPILKAQGSVSINNLNSTGDNGISGLFVNDVIVTNCNIIHKNSGIYLRSGLGRLNISNVNIEGYGDNISNNIRVQGDVNNKASLIFDNISVKNGNNREGVTEHSNSNIYIEGHVQYGRFTNLYIGSESESAKNNITINNSSSLITNKNIIFDNIVIASNSGGRCFLQSTSTTFKMLHASEAKIIIKNLEVLDSNILNKYNALHFLSDIRGGCPVFRLGRGIAKDNTGIKGTIVEYTDIPRSSTLNETQVLGEILSDVENDTWIYYSLIGVDLGKRSTGTTAQRPIVTQIGYRYYDTSLNRAVYWNGTSWVNSDPDATIIDKGLVNQTPAIVNVTTPTISTIEEADTQIQALADKINSLLTAMRTAGMIAP